ncbi:hypothetical protein BKA70DRAFT_1399130 [Coprinopsis sp. MPI-PUGE-AT-0042]|nr:hypothetical protein BKA70DRAFT_1399130 [Coprinopsis sp. MPI-PUGE-AT-0042]
MQSTIPRTRMMRRVQATRGIIFQCGDLQSYACQPDIEEEEKVRVPSISAAFLGGDQTHHDSSSSLANTHQLFNQTPAILWPFFDESLRPPSNRHAHRSCAFFTPSISFARNNSSGGVLAERVPLLGGQDDTDQLYLSSHFLLRLAPPLSISPSESSNVTTPYGTRSSICLVERIRGPGSRPLRLSLSLQISRTKIRNRRPEFPFKRHASSLIRSCSTPTGRSLPLLRFPFSPGPRLVAHSAWFPPVVPWRGIVPHWMARLLTPQLATRW